MMIKPQIKSILIIILTISTLLLGVVLFVRVLHMFGTQLSETIATTGGAGTAQESKLQALQKELRGISGDIKLLKSKTLTTEGVSDLLDTIEGFSTDEVKITVQGIQSAEQDGLVRMSLLYTGTFTQVMSITKKLLKVPYIAYAGSIDMQKREGKWHTSIQLVLPVLPNNK